MSTLSSNFSRLYLLGSHVHVRCRRRPNIPVLNQYHTSSPASGNDQASYSSHSEPLTIKRRNILPGIQRIILLRHGESLGNIDQKAYVTTADWRIPLTDHGRKQAREAGKTISSYLSKDDAKNNGHDGQESNQPKNDEKGKIFFYVSPYLRTRQTLREILRDVDPECIVGIREDPRIAEQAFGNFQSHRAIQENKAQRSDFGRFFYRFPDGGESGFDVYNRVSGFISTMRRDADDVLERWTEKCPSRLDNGEGMTICIVTHGLALRLILTRYFQYTVHEFERSYNPNNGRVVVLEPTSSGGFELLEVDRIAMGFPHYNEQERFRVMDDYSILDKSGW